MFKRQDKILVEIHDGSGISYKGKFPIEDNKVVIVAAKDTPGGAQYAPEFDEHCIRHYYEGRWIFRKLHRKLLVWNGSLKCMSFEVTKKEKRLIINEPSKTTIKRLAEAQVVKAAGSSMQQIKIPALVYVLLVVNVMVGVLAMLIGTGAVRFV